jgi:hypothetical protein
MRVIQEIETEIHKRREVADRLESDIETYNRIKDLDRAEVEAVAQALEVDLRTERRQSLWGDLSG